MSMDLRKLTYFVAVAEERSIGRAAERLCLSQPPLTRHIKALEEELGVELFQRTPRGMVLTAAGESLLQDARHIFGLFERASTRARLAGQGRSGRIDVGLYGSAIFGAIPRVLARFAEAHPEVEIALHYAQTPAQVAALRESRVLVVFERLLPREPDIEVEPVAQERLLLAVGERHRLAGRKRVRVAELRKEMLRIGTAPAAAAAVVDLCRRHGGFEPHFGPAASDVIMATLLTAVSGGVTLVPESIAQVQFPGVRYLELEAALDARMELSCFYLRGERSPLLQAMLETVRAYWREQQWQLGGR